MASRAPAAPRPSTGYDVRCAIRAPKNRYKQQVSNSSWRAYARNQFMTLPAAYQRVNTCPYRLEPLGGMAPSFPLRSPSTR